MNATDDAHSQTKRANGNGDAKSRKLWRYYRREVVRIALKWVLQDMKVNESL